jgi:hypothetical protein
MIKFVKGREFDGQTLKYGLIFSFECLRPLNVVKRIKQIEEDWGKHLPPRKTRIIARGLFITFLIHRLRFWVGVYFDKEK